MVTEIRIFHLFIPQSRSLKTKRSAIQSIVQRIRSRHNASVVELEGNDVWQRADIGVAIVSNRRDHAEEELRRIETLILMQGEVLITEVEEVR